MPDLHICVRMCSLIGKLPRRGFACAGDADAGYILLYLARSLEPFIQLACRETYKEIENDMILQSSLSSTRRG